MSAIDAKIIICATYWMDEMLQMALEAKGYRNIRLRPACDLQFFAKFRPGDYDLVVGQPTAKPTEECMAGTSWLAEVRTRDPKARILVISGNSEAVLRSNLQHERLDLGAYMFQRMPFSIDDLYLIFQRALCFDIAKARKRELPPEP
jgi:DNA-binding NtrC family response regulator